MVQRWVVVRSVWVVVEPTVWWVTSVGCAAPAGVHSVKSQGRKWEVGRGQSGA